jgi:flagellar motor component MotA
MWVDPLAIGGSRRVFVIIGSIVVLIAVAGSFLMDGGKLLLLWHPGEFIIICGAALRAFVTSNPAQGLHRADPA